MDSEAVEDGLLAASSASRLVLAVPEDDAAAEGPALGSLILWVFTDVSRDVSRFASIVLDDTVTVVSALLELFIFCVFADVSRGVSRWDSLRLPAGSIDVPQ